MAYLPLTKRIGLFEFYVNPAKFLRKIYFNIYIDMQLFYRVGFLTDNFKYIINVKYIHCLLFPSFSFLPFCLFPPRLPSVSIYTFMNICNIDS